MTATIASLSEALQIVEEQELDDLRPHTTDAPRQTILLQKLGNIGSLPLPVTTFGESVHTRFKKESGQLSSMVRSGRLIAVSAICQRMERVAPTHWHGARTLGGFSLRLRCARA
jgi:hypothetical protein